jgi:hypothetical protein
MLNGVEPLKFSILIKLNAVAVKPPCAFTSKNNTKLTIKEASIAPLPIMPMIVFDKDLRPKPLIRNPIKGNNGTK